MPQLQLRDSYAQGSCIALSHPILSAVREKGIAGELATEKMRPRSSGSESWRCCAMWGSYLASLCLHFPLCKPGGVTALPEGYEEGKTSAAHKAISNGLGPGG